MVQCMDVYMITMQFGMQKFERYVAANSEDRAIDAAMEAMRENRADLRVTKNEVTKVMRIIPDILVAPFV